MKNIPQEQVIKRIATENLWWRHPHTINDTWSRFTRRAYFRLFFPLIEETAVNRAILLMGPRRVGKTVLLHHAIQGLLDQGTDPKQICYLSVDHPLYTGCNLADLLEAFEAASGADLRKRTFVFFDEVQYHRDWEVHLKSLVDNHPEIRFVASGSAAAALKMKSTESGAGRFTDFLLPPLTFHEYLELQEKAFLVDYAVPSGDFATATDIGKLNAEFMNYLNFGGYPEVVFSPTIQADPGRFVKNDIIDKVLLRDLPSLYGIDDIQELNHLFTTLAFNTAHEVSLEELSKNSGVAKNTIKRYIDYLEAAFLIKVVHRIDRSAKRFMRANFFKVYLTNPSMRSALFSPISGDDSDVGDLVETGIFSQWFHDANVKYYARWKNGEVDIVNLGPAQKPIWAVEVKWSDRCVDNFSELKNAIAFCEENSLSRVAFTTRTRSHCQIYKNLKIDFVPASIYCHTIGRNLVIGKKPKPMPSS